jgi:tRNA pseudouridine38-40 synthase
MVRIIAGTLMEIGRGKGEPSDVKNMIDAMDRAAAGPTAVAQGLFLIKYEFPEGLEVDKFAKMSI